MYFLYNTQIYKNAREFKDKIKLLVGKLLTKTCEFQQQWQWQNSISMTMAISIKTAIKNKFPKQTF